MKEHGLVLLAELKRSLLMMGRYPVQTVANVVATYLMFMVMAFGMKALGDLGPAEMGGLLVGYVMWTFSSLVIMGTAIPLMQEMNIGVLEQVYLSAVHPLFIISYRTVVSILLDLVQSVALFILICVTFGINISLPVFPILLIVLLTGIGLYGFGLALAGAAIIYKQIGRAVQLLQLAFLFMTGALIPLEALPLPIRMLGEFFPLSQGIRVTRLITVSGQSLDQIMANGDLYLLLQNSLVYLAIGVGVFLWTNHVARRRGLLGQY